MVSVKVAFVLGSAAVALYLVSQQKADATENESEAFKEGYAAGWLTPGPFTVLAVAGFLYHAV